MLGFGALVVGYLGLPHHFAPNWWHHWMEPSIAGLALTEEQSHAMGPVWAAMAMGLFAMAAGVGAATVIYRGKNEATFTPKLPKKLFDFLFDKWRVDELYEQARFSFDYDFRRRCYGEIQQLIYADQPYTFLWHRASLWAFSKRLRGVRLSPRGIGNFYPGMLDWWVPAGRNSSEVSSDSPPSAKGASEWGRFMGRQHRPIDGTSV